MSALLMDLQTKGLLNQTLVVLGTEFGRTPRINDDDGWKTMTASGACRQGGVGALVRLRTAR